MRILDKKFFGICRVCNRKSKKYNLEVGVTNAGRFIKRELYPCPECGSTRIVIYYGTVGLGGL